MTAAEILESTIDFPNQGKDLIEEFHDFVVERMAEPIMGITDVYAKITP